MDAKNIRVQKEEKLKNIIRQLSVKRLNSDEEIEKNLSELLSIYQGDYRHDYSIFFPILYELSTNENKGSIGNLSTNIQFLKQYIDKRFLDEIYGTYNKKYRQIIKLLDHLTLEGIRLETELNNEKKFENVYGTIKKLEEATQELKRTRKKLDKATKKAKSMQTELITLLSIFSAVVLLFAVDSNYIGSAITSINQSSIFKVVFIICICGFVLVNGLYLLFNLIMFIIDRNSINDIKKESNDKIINSKINCCKIRKRKNFNKSYYEIQSHLIRILNFSLCTIIILDFVAWVLNKNHIFPFN